MAGPSPSASRESPPPHTHLELGPLASRVRENECLWFATVFTAVVRREPCPGESDLVCWGHGVSPPPLVPRKVWLQCSASIQAETWFAVWTSAPMEGMPLGVSWRQKLLPLAAGKVYPASLRKSVLPEARARTLSRRDGFMRAGVGIFHFNGPVFIFMVTFYLWPWRWLSVTRDGALLPGLRDAPCGQARH